MEEQYIEDDGRELLELIYALLKKWWIIACGGIVGAVVAMFITMYFIAPKYESSAMLYILNKTTSITSMADIQIGEALTEDFEIIASSKPVLDLAISKIEKQYGKTFTREDILKMLTLSKESRILIVKTKCGDPWDACIVANAMSEAICERLASIMKSDPPTTVESAEISAEPVSPSLLQNTVLGAFGGIVFACIIVGLLFILNDRINTESDIEKYLGVSTLAVIPYINENTRKKEGRKEKKKVQSKMKMESENGK